MSVSSRSSANSSDASYAALLRSAERRPKLSTSEQGATRSPKEQAEIYRSIQQRFANLSGDKSATLDLDDASKDESLVITQQPQTPPLDNDGPQSPPNNIDDDGDAPNMDDFRKLTVQSSPFPSIKKHKARFVIPEAHGSDSMAHDSSLSGSESAVTMTMASMASLDLSGAGSDIQVQPDDSNSNNTSNNQNASNLDATFDSESSAQSPQADPDVQLMHAKLDVVLVRLRQEMQDHLIGVKKRLLQTAQSEIDQQRQQHEEVLAARDQEIAELRAENQRLSEKEQANDSIVADKNQQIQDLKDENVRIVEENKKYTAWQLETQEAKLNAQTERRWIGPSLKNKRQAFAFSAWRSEARQRRKNKETQFWKNEIEIVSNKIVERYEESLAELRHQLALTQAERDQFRREKNQIMQNMKRAFMRGVTALNLETMAMFTENHPPSVTGSSPSVPPTDSDRNPAQQQQQPQPHEPQPQTQEPPQPFADHTNNPSPNIALGNGAYRKQTLPQGTAQYPTSIDAQVLQEEQPRSAQFQPSSR